MFNIILVLSLLSAMVSFNDVQAVPIQADGDGGCTVDETTKKALEAVPMLSNTCNTDDTAGLNWDEVQKCIESNGGVLPEGLIPASEADFNVLAGEDLNLTEEEWKPWYCATVCCPS